MEAEVISLARRIIGFRARGRTPQRWIVSARKMAAIDAELEPIVRCGKDGGTLVAGVQVFAR